MTSYPQADFLDFDSIEVGLEFAVEHRFEQEDVWRFAKLSGDFSPLHVDPVYASQTEFGKCVVHGILLSSLFSRLVGMKLPGKPALYLAQDLSFRSCVLVGETIHATAKVTAKTAVTRSITLATEIRTADGKLAVSGTARVKLREGSKEERAAKSAPQPVLRNVTVAIVAGGTGGIGSAIAKILVERGIAVALLYHSSKSRAARIVSELIQAGGTALALETDVTDSMQVQLAFEQIVDQLGEPSIAINAAVPSLVQKSILELSRSDFQRHLDYQVHASLDIARAAHPHMKRRGGGSIVNIASQVTADVPPRHMADYVTSKYALVGLSKALAIEWAEDNIRVNMVSPGLLQTDLTQHYHDRIFKMEAARTPLRRIATPLDVAHAVMYLVGEDSGFVTGENLFVTGGQVML